MPRLTTPQTHPSSRITDTRGTSCSEHAMCRHPDTAVVVRTQKALTHDDELTSQISPDHTNRTDVKRKEDEEEMNSLFADNDTVLQIPLTAAPSTSFAFPSHVGPRSDGQSTAEQRLLTPQNTQRRVVRPQTTTATTTQTPFPSTATATTTLDRNSNKKEKTKDGESRAEANAVVEAHTTEAEGKTEEGDHEEEEEVVDLVQATPQTLRSQKKDSTSETRRKRSGDDDSLLDAPPTADSAPLPSSSLSSAAAVAVMVSNTRREPTHVRQVHFPAATRTPLPLPLSPRNINEEAINSSSRNRAGTSKVSAASTSRVDTTTNSRVLAAPPHLPFVRLPAAVRDPTLGVAAPPSRAVADAVTPDRLTADPTPITTLQYTDNTEDKSATRRRVSGLTENQRRHIEGDGNCGGVAAAAAQMQTAHVWLPRRVEYLSEAPPLPQSHSRGGGARDGAPYAANQNRTRQEVDRSAIPQSVLWRRRQQEPSSLSSLSVEVTALHHPDQHQHRQRGRAQDDAEVERTERRDAYQHPSESVAPAPLSAAQWCVTAFESVAVHLFSEHASNSTAQKKTRQAHDAEDHDVSVRGRGGVEATVGVPNSSNDDWTNEDEEKGGVEDDEEGSCTDNSEDVDDTDSDSGAAMPTPTAAADVSSSRAGQRGGTRVSSTLARSHRHFYDTDAASTRGDANGEGDGNEHEDDEEEEAAAAGVVARSVRRGRGHRRPRSRSRYATSHYRHSNNHDYRDGQPATRRRLDRKESTGRQPACRTRCVDDHDGGDDAECSGDAQPTVHGPPSVAGTLRSSGGGPAACTLQLRVTLPWMLHASTLPAGVSARLLQCLESHTRATLSGSLCEDLHTITHAVQPLIDRSVADASGVEADTVGRAAAAAAAAAGGGGGVCCDVAASPPPFWIAAFAYTHTIQSQATTAAARLVHELEAMTVARSGVSRDHSRRAPHNRDGGVESALDGTENVARGAQQAQAASALSPGRTISQQHSRQTLLEHVECVRWPAWVPATHTATLVLAALTSAAFVLMNDISLALHRATVKQAGGADGHAHAGTSGNAKTSRGKADGTPRHTTTLHTAVHAFSGFCAAVYGEEECSRLCRHVRDRLPLHARELRGMMQLAAPPRAMPGRPDVDGGGVGGCASQSGKAAHCGFTSHGRDAETAGRDAAAAESSWPSLLDVIHHLARVWMRLCFPKLAARLHSFLVTHNPGVVLDGWWRVQSERNSASCSPGAPDAASSAVQNTEAAGASETSSDDLQRRVYDALHWFVFGLLQRWEKWSLLPAPQTHTNAAAASAKGLGADVLAGFSPLSPSRSDGVQWRAHVNFGKVQALRWTLHHVWVPYADTTDDEHVGASRLGLSAEIHSGTSNHKQHHHHQQLWLPSSSLMADAERRTSKLSINTTTRSSTMYAVRVDAMAVLEHLSLLPVLLETLLLRQEVTSVLQRAITGTQKCDRDNTLSARLNTFHACFRLFFGVCCYGASLVPLTAAEKRTGNTSGKEESELTVPSTRTALQTEVVEGVWREWMLPLLVQYVDSDSAIHHHHHQQQQQQLSRMSEGTDGSADYEASERCHAHSSCPRRVRLLIIAHEMTVYALTLLQLVQEGQRTGSHRHPAATVTTHSRKRTRSAASSTLSDRSHQQRHSHHDRRRFLPVSQPTPTPQQQLQSSLPSASSSRRPQWRPTAIPHNAQRSEDVVGGGDGAHNGGSCCSPYSVSSLTDASATTMTTSVASLRTLVSVSTATTQSVIAPRQIIASAAAASAGAAGGAAVESIPTSQLHYAWEGMCASPQQKQPQPFHREAVHREEESQCTEADALSSAAAAMCGGHRFPWVVPSLRPECLGGCSTGSIPGVSSHGASSDKTAPAADWRAVCRAAVRDWLACPAHAAEYTDYPHATPSHSSARHAGPSAPSVGAAAHTIHRRDVRRLRLFLLTLRECVVRLQGELQQQQQQTVLSGNKDDTAHPHNNDAEDEEGGETNRSTNRSAAAGVDGAKLYDYLYGVLPPHWRGDGGGDDSVLTVVELPSSSSSSSSITALSPSLSDFSMGGDGLRSPQQRRRRRRVRRHGHFAATSSSSSLVHRPRGVAGDGGASSRSSSSGTEDNDARQEEEEEGMISDAFSLGLRSAPTNSNGSSSCSNAGNSQADSASQSQ